MSTRAGASRASGELGVVATLAGMRAGSPLLLARRRDVERAARLFGRAREIAGSGADAEAVWALAEKLAADEQDETAGGAGSRMRGAASRIRA